MDTETLYVLYTVPSGNTAATVWLMSYITPLNNRTFNFLGADLKQEPQWFNLMDSMLNYNDSISDSRTCNWNTHLQIFTLFCYERDLLVTLAQLTTVQHCILTAKQKCKKHSTNVMQQSNDALLRVNLSRKTSHNVMISDQRNS